MLDVLEHLAEPGDAISEARRVLTPEGKLIIKVPVLYPLHDVPRDFRRWTRFGLQQDLQRQGLRVDAIEAFGVPLETAMLLANLAHAKSLLNGLNSHQGLEVLFGLTLPVAVPLRNLVGWIFSKSSRDTLTMPFGLCVVASKVYSSSAVTTARNRV
jgi:SAM-dependent methyltransferase